MKRDFDTAAKTWDQDDARTRMSTAIADAMLASLDLQGTETVLDYGTGTGIVAFRLQPHAKQVLAADSSRGMLEVLADKAAVKGVTNVQGLLLDLEHEKPGSDIRPDSIVSAMAMHHIADTRRFAKALFDLLPVGGKIALADLDTEAGDFHSDNTGVQHFGFDRDALKQLFAGAGFTDIQFQTAFWINRPTAAGVEKSYTIFLLVARKS
jgi:cyclopropane fatty-acyl-phospholipid synthase-like methyltransferase